MKVPDRVDADLVRKMMLDDFGVEIASSFGPLAGKIWRIGTMGYSCRKENVLLHWLLSKLFSFAQVLQYRREMRFRRHWISIMSRLLR